MCHKHEKSMTRENDCEHSVSFDVTNFIKGKIVDRSFLNVLPYKQFRFRVTDL